MWEVKATTLKELNDSKKMDFTAFMSNLKTHEMEIKAREEQKPQKKKSVAFKISPGSSDDEEEPTEEEIMSMIVKKVGWMFYKKGQFDNKKNRREEKKKAKEGCATIARSSDISQRIARR